jgi:basic membrane protein A and related proteins
MTPLDRGGWRKQMSTEPSTERNTVMSAPTLRLVVAAAAVSVLATACGSSSSGGSASPGTSGAPSSSAAAAGPSVAYMVPGALGDLGFFDSGKAGIDKAASDLGAKTKIVEGGDNATAAWVSNLQGLSNGSYDLVVTGSDQVGDQLKQVANQFPKQKYIMFDQDVKLPNVASITYRQSDGAFLAGVLAGLATTDAATFPKSKGAKNVGIVGGMNIPVINDFVVGFKKGAESVDPAIKVQVSYVGNFTDSQAGYNQAASMYAAGADVVFAAAGGAGLGVLKASRDKDRYSIGVDSNQNSLYPQNVLGSDLKDVGASVFQLIQKSKDGSLQYGKSYVFGIQNGGVSLAENKDLVPAAASAKLKEFSDKVVAGTIQVPCVEPFCTPATTS